MAGRRGLKMWSYATPCRKSSRRASQCLTDAVDWRSDHLWLYALALGFPWEVCFRTLSIAERSFNLDVMAHCISVFLFSKMGRHSSEGIEVASSFSAEDFRNPEFRKQCSSWLKHIANEEEDRLPVIAASSLVFPAGSRLIYPLYELAKHVLIKDMEQNSTGTDIPFDEAINVIPEDMYMAEARCRVAYNKLLQIFQKEDFVIQEYMQKAHLLTEEINEIKNEYAALQMQSSKMEESDRNKTDNTVRVEKVRSMWTLITEMLTSVKNEKEIVDSVLKSFTNPDISDGNNAVLSVPELLAHRMENDTHKCSGNLYEAENNKYLVVIQLLNESLRALRDEPFMSELKQLLQVIKKSVLKHDASLNEAEAKRQEVEYSESVNASISRKQEDWEAKWKSFLGLCPFSLILDDDPDLALTVSPLSSSNLEEEEKDNVFDQSPVSYLASVADICDSAHEVGDEEDDEPLETVVVKSTASPGRVSSVPLELSEASENRDVLTEKILKNEKDEFNMSDKLEDAGHPAIQVESPVKKEDPLKYAREKLAEEVAKAVMSDSPQTGEGKGVALEDLINTLAFDPFLTRNQIPRTPENLLSEIRSSWRKAIQTDGLSDTEQAPAEVVIEESPMDARSTVQKAAADPTFVSPAPDLDFLSDKERSQLSSTEFRLQGEMMTGHTSEFLVSKSSGVQESAQTEEQELKWSASNKSFVEEPQEVSLQYVKKSMNTADTCSENYTRVCSLPSGDSRDSFRDGALQWKIHSLSPLRYEHYIQDESFPEGLDSISLNYSTSSVYEHNEIDSTGSLKNENIKESEQDLESLFKTYEVLKKTASTNEEVLYQTDSGGASVSYISETSFAPEEGYDLSRPTELFMHDEDWDESSLSVSYNQRRYSLPSLLLSCRHLEEMASMVHEVPLDKMQKMKDTEQLNEELGMKKPSG